MLSRAALRRAAHRAVTLSGLGAPAGPHLTRYRMYRRLSGVLAELPDGPVGGGAGQRVLAISGSAGFAREIGFDAARITSADFPTVNLLDLPYPTGGFDGVVSDQVLEHVRGDPFRAVRESVRVVRPGGLVVHTTCFLNWVHPDPGDFWRFTPDALRLLCDGVAEPVEVGGWGNLSLFALTRLGLRYAPVPAARWHPLHWAATRNNPRWPVTTWLVARKPTASARGAPGGRDVRPA
ncbi:MAG TPA: methyltransferase domain-containing protein [Mycobacteriales bacterium]|nr:methyltransferase domain-containing protein [Mycobacteriales bacterium]